MVCDVIENECGCDHTVSYKAKHHKSHDQLQHRRIKNHGRQKAIKNREQHTENGRKRIKSLKIFGISLIINIEISQ